MKQLNRCLYVNSGLVPVSGHFRLQLRSDAFCSCLRTRTRTSLPVSSPSLQVRLMASLWIYLTLFWAAALLQSRASNSGSFTVCVSQNQSEVLCLWQTTLPSSSSSFPDVQWNSGSWSWRSCDPELLSKLWQLGWWWWWWWWSLYGCKVWLEWHKWRDPMWPDQIHLWLGQTELRVVDRPECRQAGKLHG